ncbi:CinA family protein [Hydrogenimonas cancrithermarum]|uniref:Competence damage-inducible protein A n=1 Tax=Hydrogenimonas cancrithermarum TaxID=2993563 RepID=A0ABN6WX32_9BACT|nr:CinA family protein [Hydrogenimonas cancrithermarum]BDY13789.1 competence damage-inducible protein A [Hydrogenimonas cancrithermarum]
MKNRLVIIGKNLYLNSPFMEYIERELGHLGFLEQIIKLPETSSETVSLLQKQIQMDGNLVIVANKSAFTPISKLLATMIDDTLILKENLLIPSKSDIYDDNSFLVHHNGCTINIALAEPGHTLPMFLIEHSEKEGMLHLFKMDEESAGVLLEPLAKTHEIEISFTTLTPGWIQVECISKKYGQLDNFLKSVKQLLGPKVVESTNIFAYLIHKLSHAGKTVTFAESCTGGLIAAQLTSEPGSSTIFGGSLVTYSNRLKAGWLGVEKEVLEKFGAVSEACVKQMLTGAKEIAQADYALAVSGIAGPGGGTPQKPVGTVFIGAKSDTQTIVEELHFDGDRNYIQKQSMLYAYKLLFHVAEEDLF